MVSRLWPSAWPRNSTITLWVWALTRPGIRRWPERSVTRSKPALPGFVEAGPSSAMRPSSITSQPSSTTRSFGSTVMRLALWISSRVMRVVRRSRKGRQIRMVSPGGKPRLAAPVRRMFDRGRGVWGGGQRKDPHPGLSRKRESECLPRRSLRPCCTAPESRRVTQPVIAGLDPAIQTWRQSPAPAAKESLGCRVKPGNDRTLGSLTPRPARRNAG